MYGVLEMKEEVDTGPHPYLQKLSVIDNRFKIQIYFSQGAIDNSLVHCKDLSHELV